MPRLAERQRDFAAALLDPELPVPPGLIGPDGEPSPRRFAVYRNNIVSGLVDALKAAFPAVRRIVGSEFFRAMARAYAVRHLPGSPILLDYGAGFPEFIDGFDPAATLPYLGDVARVEWAWTESYHAPEAPLLDPAAFAAVAPERRPGIRLLLHPSARLIRSRFPAITIWRMNVGDGVPAPIDLAAGGEDALVVRPMAEVEVRSLPEGGAEFVQTAIAADSRFDLQANLAGLIRSGTLIGYTLPQDAQSQASTGES